MSEAQPPSIIFIVPYRNRLNEKQHFSIYMKYLLEDLPEKSYKIYFSHQTDNRPFNRGATKNIGFLAMKDKYPNDYKNITFVFNDIDTLPYFKNVLKYDTKNGVVKHFFGFNYALGGIFSIKGADFEKCNGFPNYWGWGLEDNLFNERCLQRGLTIDRSTFFDINNRKDILQINFTPIRTISNDSTKQYGKRLPYGLNTIKNLKYDISNEYINIIEFTTESPHNIGTFYNQNIGVNSKLKIDVHRKNYHNVDKKWRLDTLFTR